MKIRNYESAELLLLAVLSAIATVWAIIIDHPRIEFMVFLTVLLALIAFIARFRHHRQVRTLKATGRRKKHVH